jgi:hypothetical protein
MRFRTKWVFLLIAAAVAAIALHVEIQAAKEVLWLDFDMKNIPEPEECSASFYDNFFHEQFFEKGKQTFDMPRLFRAIAGNPKPAMNVNAVDEVPDSSWFTNRHYLRHMSIADVVRGPNKGDAPNFDGATITKAKSSGVTPGMQLKDAKGDSYLIKFDEKDHPELLSAAEVMSTKILYAAGYNVPENYIAYIRPDRLKIGEKVEITEGTKKRPMEQSDLEKLLQNAASPPDGRYRVLASKILSGKPKGPFSHVGIRRDDPNDLIPHEHRREIRGLRLIASWINHVDMKEEQSLDMYVEENGRHFLRHYLLDFGSTFTGGLPLEYFHGREYAFDLQSIEKEVVTLGIYKSADEKKGVVVSPEVGIFTSHDFDPAHWRPTYPCIAFDNMTEQDAFWAMRIIMSFTEPEIRKIVETGEYSNPRNTEYVMRTLLERRQILANYWLRKVNPIASFSIETPSGALELKFRDMMVDAGLADAAATEYEFQIQGASHAKTAAPVVSVDRQTLGQLLEKNPNGPIAFTIWTRRSGTSSDRVTVYLSPNKDHELRISRIVRG